MENVGNDKPGERVRVMTDLLQFTETDFDLTTTSLPPTNPFVSFVTFCEEFSAFLKGTETGTLQPPISCQPAVSIRDDHAVSGC